MIRYPKKQVLLAVLPVVVSISMIMGVLLWGLTAHADEHPEWDKRLTPFILAFAADMKDRNVDVDLSDLGAAIVEDDLEDASECWNFLYTKKIYVRTAYALDWEQTYAMLASCLLDVSDQTLTNLAVHSQIDKDIPTGNQYWRDQLIDGLALKIPGAKMVVPQLMAGKGEERTKQSFAYCVCYTEVIGYKVAAKVMGDAGATMDDFDIFNGKPYKAWVKENVCPYTVPVHGTDEAYNYWRGAPLAVDRLDSETKAKVNLCLSKQSNGERHGAE